MRDIALGIVLLLSIIGVQYAVRYFRQRQAVGLWLKANEALKGNRFEEAERLLRKCLSISPLAPTIRSALAATLMRLNRMDEAEKEFKSLVALAPRQAEGHLLLGYFYAVQSPNRDKEAIASFAHALEHAPKLRENLRNDPRLTAMRDHPDFQSLIAEPQAEK